MRQIKAIAGNVTTHVFPAGYVVGAIYNVSDEAAEGLVGTGAFTLVKIEEPTEVKKSEPASGVTSSSAAALASPATTVEPSKEPAKKTRKSKSSP